MAEITPRQEAILKAIIEEYISEAVPIGSEMLEKKYAFGVSPATIRNEMVALREKGLLAKPHSSAGRVPTPLGFRYYIANLMKEG
ncbi:DeoR family transcriptional regulator, partial [Patescibacteria group bacterium]|nr:DeoR family transcriptional regulator [Patescibacteria group bacterium]